LRGLTGFGAAMVFVPLASTIVGPPVAIGLMWTADLVPSLVLAARSIRSARWTEITTLVTGWLIGTPFGLMLLRWLDPVTVRWAICLVLLAALPLLAAGWSYPGRPTVRLALATGILAGLAGGLTGMSGPPIVLMWLAAAAATAANVRDNLNLFFLVTTLVNGVFLALWGVLTVPVARLGLMLFVPYVAGVISGALAFRYVSDRDYRRAAYAIIAAAALLALPLLDPLLRR